jgi:hypothetical protein
MRQSRNSVKDEGLRRLKASDLAGVIVIHRLRRRPKVKLPNDHHRKTAKDCQ